jgi:hypothetical protein
MGGGPPGGALPDFNASGFDFGTMTAIRDPAIYLQPSAGAGGTAWLAMAALEWHAYRGGDANVTALTEARDWGLRYLDQLDAGYFENLLGYGALAAARANAGVSEGGGGGGGGGGGASYDVARMLGLAFQNGTANGKHGWGVFAGANAVWGGLDVGGLVGFVEEWDPTQIFGLGGREAYAGDGLWLAASTAPIARYNTSLAAAIGRWLINVCSATRLFYPDMLANTSQTDPASASATANTIPYEALRACNFVREEGSCMGNVAPFATGDYGCEWPPGANASEHCSPPHSPPCTNLAGYSGSSVGIAAKLCVSTDVQAVLQVDLLATDAFHAPAHPTFLVYNPHNFSATVVIAVPACNIVHWSSTSAHTPSSPPPALGCTVTDAVSGVVVATGIAPPGMAKVALLPDTPYVFVFSPTT